MHMHLNSFTRYRGYEIIHDYSAREFGLKPYFLHLGVDEFAYFNTPKEAQQHIDKLIKELKQ